MPPRAVIIDVAIDQGGCVETSRPTTHSQPTYIVDDVVHYCVTNMPGAVGRTSTYALTNVTLPYVLQLARKGFDKAIARQSGPAAGRQHPLRQGDEPRRGRHVRPGMRNRFETNHETHEKHEKKTDKSSRLPQHGRRNYRRGGGHRHHCRRRGRAARRQNHARLPALVEKTSGVFIEQPGQRDVNHGRRRRRQFALAELNTYTIGQAFDDEQRRRHRRHRRSSRAGNGSCEDVPRPDSRPGRQYK